MFSPFQKVSIVIGIILCLFSSVFAYCGGSGEPNDPYQISSVSDWNDLMNTITDWNKHFILINDLDLQGVMLTPVGDYNLGDPNRLFTGVFDGDDHIIRNADINKVVSYDHLIYIGLFGCVDSNGQIRNLGVEDVNIHAGGRAGGLAGKNYGTITAWYTTGTVTGLYDNVGGLVGVNISNGTIGNCYSSATVTSSSGSEYIGGLAGLNLGGTITNCYATGAVSGTGYVGGLVGYNMEYMDSIGGIITNCYASGTVSGSSRIGGLVGYNYYECIITACCSTGTVAGSGNEIGGLAGRNNGITTCCYAAGAVTGNSYVGGLVGVNNDTITDCYAVGAVGGVSYVGGLVGHNDIYGIITTCYATGAVSGVSNVGGLVGARSCHYEYCWDCLSICGTTKASFWDVQTSGRTTSAGGTGKTTAQMKTRLTFTSAGWDFVGETANGTEDIWTICQNISYPKFVWQNQRPIANAGPDQTVYAWIDGIVEVTLDGSDSNDADECVGLTYHWSWTIDGNTYEANGVNPTIELPVGVHTIELVVNDGLVDSAPDYVDVNVDTPPIANAGPNQVAYAWIDGIAKVTLDGSDSNDPDGDELTYKWTWTIDSNTYEANGVNPTIELPVGVHTIQLIVNDGLADSAPDDVNITVVAPLKSALGITPRIINRSSRQSYILALVRMPDGIMKKDISNEPLILYPGEIEASRQWIVSVPYGFGRNKKWLTEIFAFFDKDAVVDAIPANGRVELKVAGELTCGRYFYGSNTVIIIGPRRPCHFPKW